MSKWKKLLRDERGASAIEYALIASLIAVAAVLAFVNLGNASEAQMNTVENSLVQ
ncbi:Flp family type IVb pilin [Sphingomicrobium sp. XHP0239]|uniref:Flp family type IVb pilin n=1 Tax=Sphingomicrobium maritimum TaxID=3133972 RepID=UPI0031CCD583